MAETLAQRVPPPSGTTGPTQAEIDAALESIGAGLMAPAGRPFGSELGRELIDFFSRIYQGVAPTGPSAAPMQAPIAGPQIPQSLGEALRPDIGRFPYQVAPVQSAVPAAPTPPRSEAAGPPMLPSAAPSPVPAPVVAQPRLMTPQLPPGETLPEPQPQPTGQFPQEQRFRPPDVSSAIGRAVERAVGEVLGGVGAGQTPSQTPPERTSSAPGQTPAQYPQPDAGEVAGAPKVFIAPATAGPPAETQQITPVEPPRPSPPEPTAKPTPTEAERAATAPTTTEEAPTAATPIPQTPQLGAIVSPHVNLGPPPATQAEFVEKRNLWVQALHRPEIQAALLQFAISAAQPRGYGQSQFGHVMASVGEGAAAAGRASEIGRKAGLEERKAVVGEREVGAQERTAGAAETRAGADVEQNVIARKRLDQELKLKETDFKIEREKLGVEKYKADVSAALKDQALTTSQTTAIINAWNAAKDASVRETVNPDTLEKVRTIDSRLFRENWRYQMGVLNKQFNITLPEMPEPPTPKSIIPGSDDQFKALYGRVKDRADMVKKYGEEAVKQRAQSLGLEK